MKNRKKKEEKQKEGERKSDLRGTLFFRIH